MKTKIMLAAAALAAALASPALAADPTGLWQTPTNGGQVRIARCGQALCGTLVTSNHIRADADVRDEHNRDTALRSRTLRNLPMLTGFTGGPTEWRNGSVYNPTDGRTYRGTITMTNDNSLNLRGCVVAPLCKTQTWTRIQ
ncbi:DUF2147 domain-containing protein [Brevundimonas sp. TSRC1-1]|uniref:DUF2147 domain-containing protein n=1 Tax=Brevundimonas sp. TSRC1-1 TaxID=2804562 RepID=UPI003CED0E38